jgi:hypothetical protein
MKISKIEILLVMIIIIFNSFAINSAGNIHLSVEEEIFTPVEETQSNLKGYDLLIISPKTFKTALTQFTDHKNRHNIKTKIVEVEKIYDLMFWKGQDKAEKIKYFIKEAKETFGISYVLLIGSSKYIPVRYCYNEDNNSIWPEFKFISDLYYADIYDKEGNFSSWDTNENRVYGEWRGNSAEDKDIDLSPDVFLGRLPCKNRLEVKIVTKKIIKYEEKTQDEPWFKKIVLVGGDSYPQLEGYEGEENTQRALDFMHGFNPKKLWASTGNLTGAKDVLRELRRGCGFIYFDGHGAPNVWATHPPNDNTNWINGLKNIHMLLLTNGNKLPICIVSGCHNCKFDVTPKNFFKEPFFQYTWIYECWGWKLVRKIGGGSIATIGNTGMGYSKEDKVSKEGADSYLDPQFFWEYNINGTDILGEVWAKSIMTYLEEFPIDWNTPSGSDPAIDAKTVQQWVLLGDPSLKIGGYVTNSRRV